MENMNPSTEPITEGQIGKVNELMRAGLLKAKPLKDPSQDVIEHQGVALIEKFVAVFIEMVDAVSSMIVRHVKVNRDQSPKKVLDATSRKQYVNDSVVAEMPKGDGEETDVFFFKLDRYISDNDLDKEYELRGLKPADSYSLVSVNENDPAFADTHPNCTHWKDKDGKWCFVAFDRWNDDERYVLVNRGGGGWGGGWWFAGVRK